MKQTEQELIGFIDFFKSIPDHRIERKKLHKVEEILLLTFCGVIAGCDGWEDIEIFGKTKIKFLRTHLPFKNGVPSDDTLRRFFRALDPKIFELCFIDWVKSFQLDLRSKVIAIDGKTEKRSFDKEKQPLHLVSAFACEAGIVLGQEKVQDKSNEITAIPKLLDILDLEKAIVTIDAMGCQHTIAEKIIDKKAEYLLALKGNQGKLHEDVKLAFNDRPKKFKFVSHQEIDSGHGRIETRKCTVTNDIDWLKARHPKWKNLNTIVEIDCARTIKNQTTSEKRYYISSLNACPISILSSVRQHWGIENRLHWILDVTFGADQSRIRKGNAPQNIAIIRKCTINLLQRIKKDQPRLSIRKMRKLAGWDEDFLNSVLSIKF